MFVALVWLTIAIVVLGIAYAYVRTRDVFHPAVLVMPMFGFIYGWMPLKLTSSEVLSGYFDNDQLIFVQIVNCLGILAFLFGSLAIRSSNADECYEAGGYCDAIERRLLAGAAAIGVAGLSAWLVSIGNVGGLADAFSHPYSGGWDDSGYIRDGSLLMFPAVIVALGVVAQGRRKAAALVIVVTFVLPWLIQAILTARRGPTFLIAAVLALGWYIQRNTRPPLYAVVGVGLAISYLILLLVVNRSRIYWGSELSLNTDVNSFVQQEGAGNEYIYGSGTLLDSHYSGKHYWGRRYAAQLLIRPIPSSIWPTKYDDVGVGELTENAGNGTNFLNTLGWMGAPGSAPGAIADLWVEFSWLAIPALYLLGRGAALVWSKAVLTSSIWAAQYCVLGALSIYFVMQTMEAVIFRLLLLSVPLWLTWMWSKRTSQPAHEPLPV